MRRMFFGLSIAAAVLAAAPAFADTGYLTVKSPKQGEIKGEVISKGKEGALAVLNFEYSLQGNAPTGRRVQQPVSFTLLWSKATPLLVSATSSGQILSEVRYKHFIKAAPGAPGGTEVNSETVVLTNAYITSLKIIDRNGNEDALEPVVVVTMAYEKLEITHNEGGITAIDDWTK